jgi:hypothetical protein
MLTSNLIPLVFLAFIVLDINRSVPERHNAYEVGDILLIRGCIRMHNIYRLLIL